MLFHKSLVSLVIAFAAASSVSASITPVARCGYGGCPKRAPAPPPSQCNTGPIQCCKTLADSKSPYLTGLPQDLIDLAVLAPIAAALDCTNVIGATDCSATTVCCKDVSQNGLVNVACSPVKANA